MEKELLSMAQATQFCNYSQDYLSLLARRGVLEAKKIGRKWYTTREWLNKYVKEMRPNEIILERDDSQRKIKDYFTNPRIIRWSLVFMAVLAVGGIFSYWNTVRWISQLEQKNSGDKFIPTKIIQFSNDEGKIETYGSGMIRSNN
jgi:hypothetical protein